MTCHFASMLIGRTNVIPDATLLPSGNDPETPIDYLKNDLAARQTRWTDIAPNVVVQAVLPTPQQINYFALPTNNLTENAVIRMEMFQTAASSIDTLNMPLTAIGEENAECGDFVYWMDNPLTVQKLRLTMIQVNATTVSARQLIAGMSMALEYNISYGNTIRGMTVPRTRRSGGGRALGTGKRRKAKAFTGAYEKMSDNDYRALWDFEQEIGNQSFIVSPYPERNRPEWFTLHRQMLGRFVDDSLAFQHVREGRHRTTFRIEQA